MRGTLIARVVALYEGARAKVKSPSERDIAQALDNIDSALKTLARVQDRVARMKALQKIVTGDDFLARTAAARQD